MHQKNSSITPRTTYKTFRSPLKPIQHQKIRTLRHRKPPWRRLFSSLKTRTPEPLQKVLESLQRRIKTLSMIPITPTPPPLRTFQKKHLYAPPPNLYKNRCLQETSHYSDTFPYFVIFVSLWESNTTITNDGKFMVLNYLILHLL